MNKKELIKLLDKYKIEYKITDNTKEVEEGLRLLDEALEKIGIIIPKETQVDTITTENDTEVPKHTTEWANSDDLISRQAAIEAMAPFDTNHELRDTLESLPPVEPKRPKRTETMMVDGEPTEIDPLSYEVGYTHGQSERPKGKWIESYLNEWCGTDENHNSVFRKIPCVKCDQCGEKRRGKEKFCPNCGADMRGEEDAE